MKRNLPLLILVIVVALVIGGYLGFFTSFKKQHVAPTGRDVKIPPAKIVGDDSSSGKKEPTNEKQASTQEIKETNITNVNPKAGERMVWGEVKAVDVDKRVLTIDQQLDDNSVKISPNVAVNKDAIIRNKEKVITLTQVNTGDTVGIIITKSGQARAVLVNY